MMDLDLECHLPEAETCKHLPGLEEPESTLLCPQRHLEELHPNRLPGHQSQPALEKIAECSVFEF